MKLNLSAGPKPFLVVLMALSCIPMRAQADEDQRFYIAGYMGLNIMTEKDFEETSTGVTGKNAFNPGQEFAGAIGFKLTPQLRLEGEFSYLQNDFDTIQVPIFGTFPLSGDLSSKVAMLNLYYDFELDWPVQPFVGAGFGYGWHDASISNVSVLAVDTQAGDSGYVWQVGGGVKYPLGDETNITVGYRYLDGKDLDFDGYKLDYGAHQFRIGLTWDLPFDY